MAVDKDNRRLLVYNRRYGYSGSDRSTVSNVVTTTLYSFKSG